MMAGKFNLDAYMKACGFSKKEAPVGTKVKVSHLRKILDEWAKSVPATNRETPIEDRQKVALDALEAAILKSYRRKS